MRFNYLEPATLKEAIAMLTKYNGRARIMAGGTDLMVQIRNKACSPEYVVDISYIPGLDYVKSGKQGLKIGALTPVRTVEKSDELARAYPVLCQAAALLGSVAIRNVGTIGGNLCNAAPSADNAPSLIGLGAKAKITGPDGERIVPMEEFFQGPGNTVLQTGELLTEIQVPVPAAGTKAVYMKHSRSAIDLAIVGVGVCLTLTDGTCQDARIVLGAVAPTPMRAKKAEDLLKGKKLTAAVIDKSAQMASEEARPITDVRASADYRREIVKVLTRRAINQILNPKS